ncbi:MAG: Gfo/Idh/MocA family oxidoreductase [Planctomycetia bacterium]|nr:Gfo/Idh/MocA family oxidoreductase [Planctomycetia bacterium]
MTTRRNFLQAGAFSLAAMGALQAGAQENDAEEILFSSPLENADAQLWEKEGKPLRAVLIGCGWYGKSDVFRLIQCGGEKISVVGLCDVDRRVLEEAGKLVAARQVSGKVPNLYRDHREMLEREKPDVCLISTPDHWHALQMIDAVKAGCDVYVQKPIGVDVRECLAMREAVRASDRVVQVALQRRSTPVLQDAIRKYLDPHALGQVAGVTTFCDWGSRKPIRQEPVAIPEWVDFDRWAGPAPVIPYYPNIHQRRWRIRMEYGNGYLGDMAVHMLDMVRWMLKLEWPTRISSFGGTYVNRGGISNISDTQNVTWAFPDLNVTWEHRQWSDVRDPDYPWGAILYGSEGVLKANPWRYAFRPNNGRAWRKVVATTEYDRYPTDETEPGLERQIAGANRAHMWNFLARVVDRGKPNASIEQGCISSVCCILANISAALGGVTLDWDPETFTVKNCPEANALLARPYRSPWVHP